MKSTKQKLKMIGMIAAMVIIAAVLFTALYLILNRSYGWFASNEQVDGENMKVKADHDIYELAVSGTQVTTYPAGDPILTFLADNGNYQNIAQTDNGNFNLVCTLYDERAGDDPLFVSPGSYGSVSFDVVPKRGHVKLQFDMVMQGVGIRTVDNNGVNEEELYYITDPDLINYLHGHILFFSERTPVSAGSTIYRYSGVMPTSFVYDTAEHASDRHVVNGEDHYTVTFYWIWPQMISSIILPETDSRLRTHTVFSDSTEREEFKEFIEENNELFFYYPAGETSYTYVAPANMTDPAPADTGNENGYYVEFIEGYNNADQLIGDTVRYLIVTPTASLYVEPEPEPAPEPAPEPEPEP